MHFGKKGGEEGDYEFELLKCDFDGGGVGTAFAFLKLPEQEADDDTAAASKG